MAIIDKSLYNTREVKKLEKMADKILELETQFKDISDEELKGKTEEFKGRLAKGETLDDILFEAFAVLREASYRVLGMKHYKVQLIGGMVLHQGRIAEMKTGEGKTLVATLPTYLNALEGKGVHVVTVNEYLAKRDRDQMNQVYEFLGLTSSVIFAGMDPIDKKEAYNKDITYATNSELGFDYLRDNMISSMEEKVQRPLNYVVIDEIDSILIDDARTPLIISGSAGTSDEFIKVADYFVKGLKNESDYTIDGKAKMPLLTEDGIAKVEEFFKIENFADFENFHIQHYVVQALKANFIMKNGVDYIVKEGKVHIVDQNTGRIMDGRRFSDGLHEAIEAKEEVAIQDKTRTMATITYQNFFRMYNKLSGMTGTAKTEEMEFREIYGLDVVVIPTNKPILREDKKDIIYKTEYEKFKAVVDEIAETYKTKQPVLVGTVSIEKSELLSFMLKRAGIPHQVLNAKHHAKEAEIVAKAGQPGMVTISTNMAGRGTDILLGEGVRELGGLKVIGTEKHESRRIDNQLRGRAGRQGDVGSSRFYVSFEDSLIKNYTSDRFKKTLEKFNLSEGEAIEETLAAKAVENAQKSVEAGSFETRKKLIEYDDVVNTQRQLIYKQRDIVLESDELSNHIEDMIKDVVAYSVNNKLDEFIKEEDTFNEAILRFRAYIEDLIRVPDSVDIGELQKLEDERPTLIDYLTEIVLEAYKKKQDVLLKAGNVEKVVILRVVDRNWVDHLEKMEHLKQYIGLQSYRNADPVQAYQLEGSKLFDEMILDIKKQVVEYIFNIRVEASV